MVYVHRAIITGRLLTSLKGTIYRLIIFFKLPFRIKYTSALLSGWSNPCKHCITFMVVFFFFCHCWWCLNPNMYEGVPVLSGTDHLDECFVPRFSYRWGIPSTYSLHRTEATLVLSTDGIAGGNTLLTSGTVSTVGRTRTKRSLWVKLPRVWPWHGFFCS